MISRRSSSAKPKKKKKKAKAKARSQKDTPANPDAAEAEASRIPDEGVEEAAVAVDDEPEAETLEAETPEAEEATPETPEAASEEADGTPDGESAEATAGPAEGDDPEGDDEVALEGARLRACIEAILFAAAEPVPRKRLRRLLKGVETTAIDEALLALEAECIKEGRGFGLVEESGGLCLLSRPEFAPYIARLRGERKIRLSPAAFESLAVIAYRQPIRRADLEAIRGVQSGAVLKNLMEWGLLQVVGRHESLGRPLLYGTTPLFLEQFGFKDLAELPEPERFQELGDASGVEILDEIQASGEPPEPLEEEPEAEEESPPEETPEAVADDAEAPPEAEAEETPEETHEESEEESEETPPPA